MLFSSSPATPGTLIAISTVLGCTTGTRCFLPSLGQRGTAGAARAQIQRGAQNITEQCFTRFSQPQRPSVPAAMLFREALA